MKYLIEVTETYQRTVVVDAGNMHQAIKSVSDTIDSGQIELSVEDFVGREIIINSTFSNDGSIPECVPEDMYSFYDAL